MTATLHKVLAGTGYQYYLKQVAAGDSTELGASNLADYYTAHGEAPGTWHGSGLAALGITAGEKVTESQMEALFGLGIHPNAEQIEAHIIDREMMRGATPKDAVRAAEKASRLGNRFRIYDSDNEFRTRCGHAFAAHNIAHGLDPHAALSDDIRARLRTEVATDMFVARYRRPPLDERELSGWVARISRPASAAVAGFDITFSPVKSVSALWAIAPKHVADRIHAAHLKAVDDALAWLEQHGTYTRLGRNGVRQVEVEGLVVARFTHRESRCGDPDLHTHALLANKVRTLDRQWRALDGTPIYRLLVTVSEIYNTRLELHLEADIGAQFTERTTGVDPGKRPIREIVGVPWALIEHWSRRDAAITTRLGELTSTFQQLLGREPMPHEMYGLAERATLETRPAKHRLRSYAEQRTDWRTQAQAVLGGRKAFADTVSAILQRSPQPRPRVDAEWIARTAQQVLATVSAERSSWQRHHIRSETERRLRGHVYRDQWAVVAEAVVTEALSPSHAVIRGNPDIAAEPVLRAVPAVFARRSGASVYTSAGTQHYTSVRVFTAEARLAELSLQPGARTIAAETLDAAIRAYNQHPAHRDQQLNASQIAMITTFTRSPLRITTADSPAGTGKTTAMAVLADAWHDSGGTVLGLAPTAAAAAELAAATGDRVETVDQLLTILDNHTPTAEQLAHQDAERVPRLPRWVTQIDAATLVIVDEHVTLSDTKRLQLMRFLTACGATIRCVGDTRQLPAIEAGGTATDPGPDTVTLTHVLRFAAKAEATATLGVRDGDPTALGFYLDHGRIHAGAPGTVLDDTYTGWVADYTAGRDTLMLAATHDMARELNARARADRLARSPHPGGRETRLSDELCASAGDTICTRHNDRRLRLGATDWVRNGYRWRVDAVHDDGSITATHVRSGGDCGATVLLPAAYVRAYVRLGYAATINSVQGITVGTCHVVVTGRESRNQFYVAVTRGRDANHAYVVTALDGSETSFWTEPALLPRTAAEVLLRVLGRDATQKSAHTQLHDALNPFRRLGRAVDIYLDAIGVAAENAVGPETLAAFDTAADALYPGLTDAPAYPVLRQHLATLALSGADPIAELGEAIADRELDTARDAAAVLDWRLDSSRTHSTGTGPLPWLRGLPPQLPLLDEVVAEQLHARGRIITALADQIRTEIAAWTPATAPMWVRPLLGANPFLVADLAIWRAAQHLDDTDLRLTGPARNPVREHEYQQRLDARVTNQLGDLHAAAHTWGPLAKQLDTRIIDDPWWPVLADRLDIAARAGLDIDTLLTTAAGGRPLPDEMPAAALWSRLELDPSALEADAAAHRLRPDWTPHLTDLLGPATADRVLADPAWPRVVAAVDRATGTDWTPHDLLTTAHELLLSAHPDTHRPPRDDQLATALAWRIEALLAHPTTPPPPIDTPDRSTTMNPDTPQTTPSDPDMPGPAVPPPEHSAPADTTNPGLPEHVQAVAALFRNGEVDAALRVCRDRRREFTTAELDVIARVTRTLYRHSYPVARARLQWAATNIPAHRRLITACTPATDPGLYRPAPDPSPMPDRRAPARDHRAWIDHTRRRPPAPPDTTSDLLDAYHHANTDTDDPPQHTPLLADAQPNHMPIPEGTGQTRYTLPGRDTTPDDTYPLDYDLAAIPDTRRFACVDCGIERHTTASTPPPGRRSDDGLCDDCRADGRPAIPDHDPTDHIQARCTHLTTTRPAPAALAALRADWRAAHTPTDRATIENWVHHHLTDDTAADHALGRDPTRMLTDTELAQHIRDLHQQLASTDTRAQIFGPAPGHRDDTTQVDDALAADTAYFRDRFDQLRAEQQRRIRLTPAQRVAEDRMRSCTQSPGMLDTTETDAVIHAVDPDHGLDL
ncbi:MobF family relaxase [Nocardia terpenica]|nr:MobF family relaxase [Nocardia terpenica]NQE91156.1 relaxase domain-containing protein [Nocardia terpenica]